MSFYYHVLSLITLSSVHFVLYFNRPLPDPDCIAFYIYKVITAQMALTMVESILVMRGQSVLSFPFSLLLITLIKSSLYVVEPELQGKVLACAPIPSIHRSRIHCKRPNYSSASWNIRVRCSWSLRLDAGSPIQVEITFQQLVNH